jgi:peptidoglycan/xylan/chitin deacetylase (PgdA/CDA1 family)
VRLQPAQPDVDHPAEQREGREQVQERHALQHRPELLRPREDEDDQRSDAGDREHAGGTIPPTRRSAGGSTESRFSGSLPANTGTLLLYAGWDGTRMRERVAGLLHKAGALSAVMQLRRLVPMPTLSIVTYHHVADHEPSYPFDPDIADASLAQFRRQLEMLARHGTPIGVADLLRAVEGGPLPKNPVMVTFDDGYRSCHDIALPILRQVGVPATFFISTSFITERRLYWWERIALLLSGAQRRQGAIRYPRPLELDARDPGLRGRLTGIVKTEMLLDVERFLAEVAAALGVEWSPEIEARHADRMIMTWDQIRALAKAGMDVESHTRRHRVLQTLAPADLEDELAGSRKELEAQLDRPVRVIAYPVGRRIADEARIRRALTAAGYRAGMSNKTGVNRLWPAVFRSVVPPIDPFDIRRLAIDRSMSDAMFLTQVAMPSFAYTNRINGGD